MVLCEEELREYYNAETGVGQGRNPFWGWTSLALFMPFEAEFCYDPTSITDDGTRKLGCEVFDIIF